MRRLKPSSQTVFLLLVAAYVWLALESISSNFIMVDEFGHLPAGVTYLQTGRFFLYRENPPLVQAILAVPAFLDGATVDYQQIAGRRSEWSVGQQFMWSNAQRLPRLIQSSRCMILGLGAACGALIFWWSREAYGPVAALIAAALWFADPSVLFFSGAATSDVGSAAFGLIAAYTFHRFLSRPTRRRAVVAGIALGLAQVTKFNLIVLYPAWLVWGGAHWVGRRGRATTPGAPAWTERVALAEIILVTSLIVLNGTYQFEGSFQRLGLFEFKSHALTGHPVDLSDAGDGNRFVGTLLENLPVPLPKNYVLGLDSQRWEAEVGLDNLSGGRVMRGGRWYSPLRTLAYKLPVGTLLILAAAIAHWAILGRRSGPIENYFWIPAAALIGTLCTQTGLNWPIRYAISALPFLFLATGPAVADLGGRRWGRCFLIGCLSWNAVELILIRPYYLAYGNVLAGGTQNAQSIFHGSNYDWGQDLQRLRAWHDENPGKRPFVASYYGPVGADYLDLPVGPLPVSWFDPPDKGVSSAPKTPFYWAVSSNLMNGIVGDFSLDDGRFFQGVLSSPALKPGRACAQVGSTIFVFRIVPDGTPPGSVPQIEIGELRGCLRIPEPGERAEAAP